MIDGTGRSTFGLLSSCPKLIFSFGNALKISYQRGRTYIKGTFSQTLFAYDAELKKPSNTSCFNATLRDKYGPTLRGLT